MALVFNDMSISQNFKTRINYLIGENDSKRNELIGDLKLSSNTLTNATFYGIVPTTKTLVKFADYFNVSITYLLGRTNENDFIPAEKKSDFKTRFLLLCDEKGYSRYKVSKLCGLESSSVARWLKNGYIPALETIDTLCDYFSVSPDYLLGRTDYRN